MQTKGEQDRFVGLPAQVFERKIPPQSRVQPKLRTHVENFANLRLQDVAWKAILGNAEMHHAAGNRSGFENGYGIPEKRQVVRCGHSGGPGADDGDLFSVRDRRAVRKNINGIAGLGPMALGYESLQRANGNRQIEISAAARRLARMAAHAAANG